MVGESAVCVGELTALLEYDVLLRWFSNQSGCQLLCQRYTTSELNGRGLENSMNFWSSDLDA